MSSSDALRTEGSFDDMLGGSTQSTGQRCIQIAASESIAECSDSVSQASSVGSEHSGIGREHVQCGGENLADEQSISILGASSVFRVTGMQLNWARPLLLPSYHPLYDALCASATGILAVADTFVSTFSLQVSASTLCVQGVFTAALPVLYTRTGG